MKPGTRLLLSLLLCAVATALAATFATRNVTAAGGNPSANLDQCANGPAYAPVPCTGSAWQNGNANASNAHWAEGDSIAYRMKFGGLVPGSTHHVTIQWDTTKGGKHALDYLTSYNRTETDRKRPLLRCGWLRVADHVSDPAGYAHRLEPAAAASQARLTDVGTRSFTMFNGTIIERRRSRIRAFRALRCRTT